MAIVEVMELRKQYDPPKGVLAVDGVSFDIAEGEIFSLLGPNGAGKSTTISMLRACCDPAAATPRRRAFRRLRAAGVKEASASSPRTSLSTRT